MMQFGPWEKAYEKFTCPECGHTQDLETNASSVICKGCMVKFKRRPLGFTLDLNYRIDDKSSYDYRSIPPFTGHWADCKFYDNQPCSCNNISKVKANL